MNSFNEFYDLITTFHFGIVKYNNDFYCVFRDQLFDEPFSNANKLLRKSALRELSEISQDQAFYKLTYLKAIVDHLAEFKKDGCDFNQDFRRFLGLSNQYNVIVKFGDSDGPINGTWSAGVFKTVGNLRKVLDDEIWVRQRMIEELNDAFHNQLNMSLPILTNEAVGSKWERTGISNIRPADEIDWKIWLEINLADRCPNDQVPMSEVEKAIENISTKEDINYFEKEVLNDDGFKILPRLVVEYSKCQPARIVGMIYALEELKLLKPGMLEANDTRLAKSLSIKFHRKYSITSINDGLGKNNKLKSELYLIRQMLS